LGQANLPMLNRAGESIFWASNNENFINYARGFAEGFFFQMFLAFLLSNKAYNFFFFSYFHNVLEKKKLNSYVVTRGTRHKVMIKFHKMSFLKKMAKSVKKTFKFTDFFFSKVFFFSYYKFVIVTIKIYTRFFKRQKFNYDKFMEVSTLFWKYYFISFFLRQIRGAELMQKKF
jgi:hypothetical protein